MWRRGFAPSLHNLHQVRNFRDHAANRQRIWTFNHLVQPGETESLDDSLLLHRRTNGGAHPLEVQLDAVVGRYFWHHNFLMWGRGKPRPHMITIPLHSYRAWLRHHFGSSTA